MSTAVATFANGCFWCTEAIFQQLNGVTSVIPGFTGGKRENPTYDQVTTGVSGHAEAIQITFDPNLISYENLLDVFWHTHNPTTLNRQNFDIGTEYRSAIFYHNEEQKNLAEKSRVAFEKEGLYKDPIVTEITPAKEFYPADDYHKNYYLNNSDAPYCQVIIKPKMEKFWQKYKDLIKS